MEDKEITLLLILAIEIVALLNYNFQSNQNS